MVAALSDPSLGTSRSIGQYFGLVSAIPTVLLTGYLALLIASGAWTHRPDFGAALDVLTNASVGAIIGLLAVTLALALVLHTVQFAIVQLLEGYWGGNPVSRFLRARRTLVHLARRRDAWARFERANDVVNLAELEPEVALMDPPTRESVRLLAALVERADAANAFGAYPDEAELCMPTRLGNALRKWETNAGQGYELKVLQTATHLALVAPQNHVSYLQDQRNALELATRLCTSALIASLATAILMWPWGPWLLLATVPYALAYVSYRGAVVAAGHYGNALTALVDLNRFRLYEALHLPLPEHTEQERQQNLDMAAVMAGEDESVRYEHPDSPPKQPEAEPEDAAAES